MTVRVAGKGVVRALTIVAVALLAPLLAKGAAAIGNVPLQRT